MSGVEGSGRTIEEAVENALRQMGVRREAVDVEILQEPRPALLGFGGREARVRITSKPDAADAAKAFAAGALELMGYQVTPSVVQTPDGMAVDLQGRDLGRLIGRHGRTLDALEVLLALHLHQHTGHRVQVTVDAAGYKARREKALIEQARRAAARAAAGGAPVTLDPMEPRDRRVVHLALRDDPGVSTLSEGEGADRHVVIVPRRPGAASPTADLEDDSEDRDE